MLDQEIINQLKNVFSILSGTVGLHIKKSNHEKQSELESMLDSIASCSNNISIIKESDLSIIPEFWLSYQNVNTGVSFKGIPGGHEFTSLILAILNSAGQGKFPDQGIVGRIKQLPKLDLKTYVSLSCENCPEVVQSLNLISFINPQVTHQMINGELVTEEVESLKIQGVPSVFLNNELFLTGKNNLGEILNKLESLNPNSVKSDIDLGFFDVAIIGGGPAGVSSAIYTARKGLKVALIAEQIGGQVRETKGIENLIGISYIEGIPLSQNLQEHLNKYSIEVLNHRKVSQIQNESHGKKIKLNSGESLFSKAIIVATGAKWRELNIPGEKEYLGRGVAFCPHCDGPFYAGKNIAVIGGGNSGVEAAIDLAGIVNHITLIEFNQSLKADDVLVKKLKSLPNVSILTESKTLEIIGNGEKVVSLKINHSGNESVISLDGVFIQIGLVPNSKFLNNLVETNKFGEIIIDDKNRTNQLGIYAAGDVTTIPFKQIIISMGEGAKAGLSVFEDLIIKNNLEIKNPV